MVGWVDLMSVKNRKKDDDETIELKYYVFNNEGFNDPNDDDGSANKMVKRRQNISERCGCKAQINGNNLNFTFISETLL